jgi:hypothetical protein
MAYLRALQYALLYPRPRARVSRQRPAGQRQLLLEGTGVGRDGVRRRGARRAKGNYWGRFDTQGKDGQQYSLLAEKDRKEQLKDIPDWAFPKPGATPQIPEAKDGVALEPPPKELPEGEPNDLPKDKDKK